MSSKYTEHVPKTRIHSLYSDMDKLKELNPEGYEANIAFWEKFIMSNVSHICFNIKMLLHSLTVEKYGEPQSLDKSIDRLVENEHLIPVESFAKPQSLLRASLKWAISNTLVDLSFKSRANQKKTNYLKDIELIHMKNLEKSANSFLEFFKDCTNNCTEGSDGVYTIEHINALFKGKDLSEKDLHFVLVYLSYYKKLLIVDSNIVKFKKSGIDTTSQNITISDTAMANINWSLYRQDMEIEKTSELLSEYKIKIRKELLLKNKPLLKSYLKAKKLILLQQKKFITQQDNLTELKHNIQTAMRNKDMQNILESSSLALRSLNNEIYSVERVETLVSDIENESAFANKVSKSLTLSTQQEYEVQEELEKLLKENKPEEQEILENESVLDKLGNLNIEDTPIEPEVIDESEKKLYKDTPNQDKKTEERLLA